MINGPCDISTCKDFHRYHKPKLSERTRTSFSLPILTTLSRKAKWLGIALDPSLLHVHDIQPTYEILLFLQNYPESIWFFPVFPWSI